MSLTCSIFSYGLALTPLLQDPRNTDRIFSVHWYLIKGVVKRVCGNAMQKFSFTAEGQQVGDIIHSCRFAPSH